MRAQIMTEHPLQVTNKKSLLCVFLFFSFFSGGGGGHRCFWTSSFSAVNTNEK